MTSQIQHRRGTTTQHATFTGAIGEITVDTVKKTAVVHDGATAGGIPLATEAALALKADDAATTAALAGKADAAATTAALAAKADAAATTAALAAKADAAATTAALAGKANTADVYTKAADPIPMAKSPPRLVWVNGTTVTVKADKCRDELDAVNLVFPSDINVVLAGAPTTAHRHVLVGYDGSGNPAAVFSTTDALPGGWQAYRRVGSIRTDGVGAIRQFNQYGDRFLYTSVITDILGSVAVNQLYDVQVPVGVPIDALVRALAFTNAAYMTVASPDESAPSNTSSGSLADLYTPSSVSAGRATIPTSTGQLRVLVNAATSWRVAVLGWIDRRGRDK